MIQLSVDRVPYLRRCVEMALAGIHREFPCQFPLVLSEPTLFQRPRDWTPAFYGCYDWHSAVHSHWLLVRWLSLDLPDASLNSAVRAALAVNLTEENLNGEYRFLSHSQRTSFERPYGLAWLLQLIAELHEWPDPIGRTLLTAMLPLEQLAAMRFREWLPRLYSANRTGEHSQTAFALGLAMDWADIAGDVATADAVREASLRFYSSDTNLPLGLEPSGHDFLSPALATADLMRRVLDCDRFGHWLSVALPGFPAESTIIPVPPPADMSDGKLAHLVGLNFSRAWMLNGIAHALPSKDVRRSGIAELAQSHLAAGLPMLACNEYAVTHWVGSFAVYALTSEIADCKK